MSENELNWWLARSTKKPFLGDQINIYGAKEQKRSYVDWFYVDPSEDEDFVRDGLQKIKDIKEKRNG